VVDVKTELLEAGLDVTGLLLGGLVEGMLDCPPVQESNISNNAKEKARQIEIAKAFLLTETIVIH